MFCRKCGNSLDKDNLKCNICGEDNSKKSINVSLIIVIGIIIILLIALIYLVFSMINKNKDEYRYEYTNTNSYQTTTKRSTTTTQVINDEVLMPVSDELVNVYVFYGSTCQFCAELHSYLKTLESDLEIGDIFRVVDYEIWNNSENYKLLNQVALENDFSIKGVPVFIIGNKIFQGYSSSSNDKIKSAIKDEYNNFNRVDLVIPIIEELFDTTRKF